MDAVSSIPTASARRRDLVASPALALFLALFASQSGVLVLSPILKATSPTTSECRSQPPVSSGSSRRRSRRPLALLAARSLVRLLATGSDRERGARSWLSARVASAVAPSFAALALAQVPLWAGISMLLTAAIAASSAWSTPDSRTRVVASMYAGPPAAWIVGMPLIGVVAQAGGWRFAFLVL